MNTIWVVAAVLLTGAAVITMFRLLAGPGTLDRLVALDTFVAVTMCAIGTWAAYSLDTTVTYSLTALALISFVGSGSKQALLGTTYSKSGSAILSATVGAVRARTISRASAGILERSGIATDIVSWGESGKGIATFTAGGVRSYGRIPGGVTIVTQVGVEVTVEGGLGAGVEVEDGSGALVTVA